MNYDLPNQLKWKCERCGDEFFHLLENIQQGKITIAEPYATLRDQFAMAAVTGIVAGLNDSLRNLPDGGTASLAYTLADEMLEARKQ